MPKLREVVKLVTVPISGSAITYPVSITTDGDIDEIVGIQAFRLTDGGLPSYNVGFKDSNSGSFIKDISHVDSLVASTAVPKSDRWNIVNAPATAKTFNIIVETAAANASAITFQFVMICSLK